MYKIEDYAMMTPMRYYNNEDESNLKRQAMLDNQNEDFIATEKHDGDWAMLIHYSKGHNLIRSRSISKVTGVYGDYTAKVPHIVQDMDNWPDETVMLAELCWDKYGTNANTVGTILRCLPAKAIERQKEQKLSALGFDILMVNHCDMSDSGYEQRFMMLKDFCKENPSNFIKPTELYFNNFREVADNIIAAGGEGCVIQRKDYTYCPGCRTAWKTLKLKQQLPEMELQVVGTLIPNKNYDGDCVESWKYWEVDDIILTSIPPKQGHSLFQTDGGPTANWELNGWKYRPVTKPYFMHWKNGIIVKLPDGTQTDVASGLTDADREWLATVEAEEMIKNGELFAVVKAMSFNDKGRLRHPSLVRLRNDI